MAIEKSVLEVRDIEKLLKEEYGITEIISIKKLDQGSSNLYKIDSVFGKFVLKEYNSDRESKSIEKEINVVQFLKSKNLKVPFFCKRINGEYISTYNGKIITLQEFIDGYTIDNNTGEKEKVIQSARLLGKIIMELKEYEDLDQKQCMEKMFSKEALERAIGIIEKEYEDIKSDNRYRKIFIRDLQEKINMGKSFLKSFDFELLNSFTISNTHGDYSVRQLIFNNYNNEVAVIDFENARKMPIVWEIIRSYSYIDKKAKNAEFDIDNLVEYFKEVNTYIKLNENDLRFAPHIYLMQLVCSPFGYREYNQDYSQKELLRFGMFRTKLCRYLFKTADYIGEQLVTRVNKRKEELDR